MTNDEIWLYKKSQNGGGNTDPREKLLNSCIVLSTQELDVVGSVEKVEE